MASVDTLKSWRRTAKNNRNTYKKRKKAVETPYENGFKMDDYYDKIKRKVNDCTSELENGIKGMSKTVNAKCNAIESHKESSCLTYQYQFSEALSYMAKEIGRCQTKVNQYQDKMDDYERQIKDQGGVIFPWE